MLRCKDSINQHSMQLLQPIVQRSIDLIGPMQFSESLRLLFLSLFLLSIRFGPLLIHYLAIWWLLEVRDWRKRTGKISPTPS